MCGGFALLAAVTIALTRRVGRSHTWAAGA
jgi:hypothetical protein